MRKILGIAAAFMLLASPAMAQMVTKAPPSLAADAAAATSAGTPCTPTSCTGPYGGLAVGNGIFAADLGDQFWNGTAFLGAEAGVGAQLYTDANLVANENGFFSYQILKAGGSLSGLTGATPAAPSGLPSLTANVIAPYAFAGAVERQIGPSIVSGWTVGGGVEYAISAKLFADVKYFYNSYSNTAITNESLILAGANYKF